MTGTISESILSALGRVLKEKTILHEPEFAGNEWAYLKECLDTTFVSSVGKFVDRFEAMLAEYTGVKRAVAVVNGTAALHVSLELAGVEPGDEVIIPALTFVATANAVAYCGAIPHLADVSYDTLGIDPVRLGEYLDAIAVPGPKGAVNKATGRRLAACVPMHAFGHPVDMDALAEVCARHGIPIVEDAAESLGSFHKGRHTGNVGLLSVLSFNGNKILTTGGGGAILTNDEALGSLAKHITTTAKVPHPWAFVHDRVGYNYRLPNLNAALGCAQLERLPDFLARKRALAERYAAAFEGVPGVRFFREPAHGRSNYWLNVILLDRDMAGQRDKVLESTNAAGFMTRPVWTPIHKLSMYAQSPRMDLFVSEDLEGRIINIPSSAKL
jgi:perosamine synthetase